jgi:hypothetical protein
MTAAHGQTRPLPSCPAWHGKGTDISAADFTLIVEDCERGPDGRLTATEVFGYFRLPDQGAGDLVQTASIVVPVGSPIARLAHQLDTSPDGASAQITGAMLRGNVARCPCTATVECPALNETSLLLAMEKAAGSEPS